MGKYVQWIVTGFFATIALTIIFVKAGNGKGGQSGGQQTAQILGTAGNAVSQVAHALEGN